MGEARARTGACWFQGLLGLSGLSLNLLRGGSWTQSPRRSSLQPSPEINYNSSLSFVFVKLRNTNMTLFFHKTGSGSF